MTIKFYDIVEEEPVVQSNLAKILYRSTNSISTIVDRMENEGLIEKKRDLPDRRAIRLVMTQKAETILKKDSTRYMALVKSLCSIYTLDELETLIALMEKFKSKAGSKSGIKKYRREADLSNYPKMVEFLIQLINGG
jgi:DNA-binding MarR family transcriptional regulator